MLKVRLQRFGAKKKPVYRVVIADARAKRDGGFVEQVGFYDPRTEPSTIRIDEARALYWMSKGAQPTDRVIKLLKIRGILPSDNSTDEKVDEPQPAHPAEDEE